MMYPNSPGDLEAAATTETVDTANTSENGSPSVRRHPIVAPSRQFLIETRPVTTQLAAPLPEETHADSGHPLLRSPNSPRRVATPSSLPRQKPPAVQHDDRSVSWGSNKLDPCNNKKNNNNNKVDLQSLMSANPLESEAEAYILRSLEETDPTMPVGHSDAQQTIIGPNVPVDASPGTFEYTTIPNKTKKGHGRKNTSTAEDLFQLSNDLLELNQQHHTDTDRRNEDDGRDLAASIVLNHTIPHPSILMKRTPNRIATETSKCTLTDSPTNQAATSRWNQLKTNAQKASTSNSTRHINWSDTKKTDGKMVAALDDAADTVSAEDRMNDDEDGDDRVGSDEQCDADELPVVSAHSDSKRNDDIRASRSLSERRKSREAASRFRKKTLPRARKVRIKDQYKDFEEWFNVKRLSFYIYIKTILLYIILPATGIASILFYAAENPTVGYGKTLQTDGSITSTVDAVATLATQAPSQSNSTSISDMISPGLLKASWSWWVLFVFVRQLLTLSLSLATQALIIEYMILRSKLFVRLFGSFVTLFVIQSKGWPFVAFMWTVYDFSLLWGDHPWTEHWLWWQTTIDMMNANNPSGGVTATHEYMVVLVIMMVVSFVVMLKRFWLSLFLGKQTYLRYGGDLARIMRKSLLIGQVAGLGRDKEVLGLELGDIKNELGIDLREEYNTFDEEDNLPPNDGATESMRSLGSFATPTSKGKAMTRLQKNKVDQLLGAWEEPEVAKDHEGQAQIAAIIQFRQSLSYLNSSYPFSSAFGRASTRKECIQSSEALFARLAGRSTRLDFDLIALLAIKENGDVDEDKLKALISVFRPDREGNLNLLEFTKSIDTVYKESRLLRASVANSSKMDRAFEHIVNIVFYFLLVLCVLAGIGIAPDSVLSPVGAFIVGLGFMIGSASSKYLEGILFILVRRPYDIGDRINISDPLCDTSATGSPGWIVKDLNLYSTTVVYASTNEEATYSNGALAGARTINMARSFRAQISCTFKFPIDAPYEKLMLFKKALEKFVLARPREFASFVAFRATRVEADLGYVEYGAYALHRESWQETPTILQSKADLNSFALELSKKMNLRYRSPPMPVDLTLNRDTTRVTQHGSDMSSVIESLDHRPRSGTATSADFHTVADMFNGDLRR